MVPEAGIEPARLAAGILRLFLKNSMGLRWNPQSLAVLVFRVSPSNLTPRPDRLWHTFRCRGSWLVPAFDPEQEASWRQDQAHQIRCRCGRSHRQRLRTAGHHCPRIPLQSHRAWPQGLHAPVPHELGRAPQAEDRQFGELTVEQARSIAQDWLADIRKGNDQRRQAGARMAPVRSCAGSSSRNTRSRATSPERSIPTKATSTGTSSGAGQDEGADLTRGHHGADAGQGAHRRHGQPASGLPAQDAQHGWGIIGRTAPTRVVTSPSIGKMARRATSSTTSWRASMPISTGRMPKGWSTRP